MLKIGTIVLSRAHNLLDVYSQREESISVKVIRLFEAVRYITQECR